jgi:hypothetical protein
VKKKISNFQVMKENEKEKQKLHLKKHVLPLGVLGSKRSIVCRILRLE